ncbi:MAG: hypothetical protein ACFE9T_07410 [Promethearchaeota archaeon]
MSSFFTVLTLTPWDTINSKLLSKVKLFSLKNIFKTFPVIQQEFFDDLLSKVYNYNHYSWIKSLKRIIGPNNEDYDISNWNFIWAVDMQNRMFQFLFQKIEKTKGEDSQGILVALAPPELAKLFAEYKEGAILRILSLLNNPSNIKFLMILAPKGKSIAEEQQLFQVDRNYIDKLKYTEMLKNMPNIQGAWFPSYKPKQSIERCPICNELMRELKDYRVGFGGLVCPHCGYKNINVV